MAILNRTLHLLLAMAVVTVAMAGTVNRQQARETAARFMQQKGLQLDERAATARQGYKAPDADQPFYVFNATDGGGFVVVSGSDRTDAILGYTLNGSYDEDDLPPALMEWLEQMAAEVENLTWQSTGSRSAEAPEAEPQDTAARRQAIAPMIATNWNQGNNKKAATNTDGIYNILLPQVGGVHTPAGCLGVSAAQLMYYYQHPKEPTAAVPGYAYDELPEVNTSVGLPAIQFQWDKMKTSYTAADSLTEEAFAVSELMLYVGYACGMKYRVSGSSANQSKLSEGFAKYFGYDPYSWKYVQRYEYSVEEWEELMYSELASGRPVLYEGTKTADKGGIGHSFLCDGYDGAGLFHFNWGWGGKYNGYFKLQATNPFGANDSPGYVFNNGAVIGLQPNTGIIPPADPNANDKWKVETLPGIVTKAENITLKGTVVSMRMLNNNSRNYKFNFGIGKLEDDGTMKLLQKDNGNYAGINPGWYCSGIKFDLATLNLPEGKHRLVPVSKLTTVTEWKRCQPADVLFEVTVSGNDLSIVLYPIVNLQVNKFEMVTSGSANNWQNVLVNITNNGDNFDNSLYVHVDGVWPKWTSSKRELKIAAGNTKEFVLATGDMTEGPHTLTLVKGYLGQVIAKQEVVIRQDLTATAVAVGQKYRYVGTTLPVDVTVENRASDYILPVYLFASQMKGIIGNCIYSSGTGIPAGGSEDVRLYFKPDTAGKWFLRVATDAAGENVIGETAVVIEEAKDLNVLVEYLLTGTMPGGVEALSYDLNDDKEVDMADAAILINILLGNY